MVFCPEDGAENVSQNGVFDAFPTAYVCRGAVFFECSTENTRVMRLGTVVHGHRGAEILGSVLAAQEALESRSFAAVRMTGFEIVT
jgi:hypothetical protein